MEEIYEDMTGGAAANRPQASVPPQASERTYKNVSAAARALMEEIYDEATAGAAANRPQASVPPQASERAYKNVSATARPPVEEIYEDMTGGAAANRPQASVPPQASERTYKNVSAAARALMEEIYDEATAGAAANRPQASVPPQAPERTYKNVGAAARPEVEEIYDEATAGAGANGPQASIPPRIPERRDGNPGTAASPEAEAIYEVIDPPGSIATRQPPQWRQRPVAQPNGGATATVDAEPYQVPTSHRGDSTQAYRKLSLAHLKAVGIEDPELKLLRLYRQEVSAETQFDRQVRRNAERHQDEIQKHAYLQAIFEIADGNSDFFKGLSQHGKTEEERQYLGGKTYTRHLARSTPFVGPTTSQYLQSFDSQPKWVHERVYREALESGLSHALGMEPAPLPVPSDATRL